MPVNRDLEEGRAAIRRQARRGRTESTRRAARAEGRVTASAEMAGAQTSARQAAREFSQAEEGQAEATRTLREASAA